MNSPARPFPAYVFDAYGTLFDVHAAARRHTRQIGSERAQRLSELWRQKQIEYTWIRALTGRYRNFEAVTTDALDFALRVVAPDCTALKPDLMAGYFHLDAYPEVPAVLAELKRRGARTAILSNGTPTMLASAVKSAGLAPFLDATLSVDALSTYKTDPRVYQLAVDALGIGIQDISFQSSNRWDIAGAVAFGFSSVWVNRAGNPDEYAELGPRAVVRDLSDLLAPI